MSEKEFKIAELASVWGVSVPATWNRVRKEELKTIKKVDENRKEVTYVIVSNEIINKYYDTTREVFEYKMSDLEACGLIQYTLKKGN